MQVQLGRAASFSSHAFTLGGLWTRNEINAVFTGQGAECTLNGLYRGDGRRLIDNHTFIDHAVPHCASHELYKGVLGDKARGVFNGKIFVRQDAQKTDAKQTNKTLLLSDDATINTKPQLEIYADDVKCTHGATVGQLDDESIFYLRSRGVGLQEARHLLTYAFANDVIGRIKVRPLREQLGARRCWRQRPEPAEEDDEHQAVPDALSPRIGGHRPPAVRRQRQRPARISRSCSRRFTASRWSISTTPPPRRSRRR